MSWQRIEAVRLALEFGHFLLEVYDRWSARQAAKATLEECEEYEDDDESEDEEEDNWLIGF